MCERVSGRSFILVFVNGVPLTLQAVLTCTVADCADPAGALTGQVPSLLGKVTADHDRVSLPPNVAVTWGAHVRTPHG